MDQTGLGTDPGDPLARGQAMTGAEGSEQPLTVTRSEEELRVGVARRPYERVRLVKHVVTEMVTREVPVRREEIRVEREPIVPGTGGPTQPVGTADEDLDIVLYEEEVVLGTRIVPRERVRLVRQVVTEQRPISDELRRENIEVEGADLPPGTR